MSGGVRFKVCGITRAEDAQAAAQAGASWLGFNLFRGSPRYLPLEKYRALLPALPKVSRGAVMVEPTAAELSTAVAGGFDFIQVHFRPGQPGVDPKTYLAAVGAERLWLAPKLLPGADVPADVLPLASTFLFDTYQPDRFGGTGKVGDWAKFRRHREAHPAKTWLLAGGLSPENLQEAVAATGATIVDLNSGVESAPGIKDALRIADAARVLSGG